MYIDIKRIEFVITEACSGKCKHCSNGGHKPDSVSVDADAAFAAIRRIVERYQVELLMTFGGEPLLYAETRRLLKSFTDKGIGVNGGNDIFAAGNAVKYLSEWFPAPEEVDLTVKCGSAPYTSPPDEIGCFCVSPNGDVTQCSITIGNIYKQDALDILESYDPYSIPAVRAVLNGGVPGLMKYAKAEGITVDLGDCRSACGMCQKIMAAAINCGVALTTKKPETGSI